MTVEELIPKLTLEEKAALLQGWSTWTTREVKRLGIPAIFLSDGPHGLRKQAGAGDHLGLNASVPATCFPTAAAMANSWDVALGEELGRALGEEAAANDVNVVLGPGLNMKRSPLCGRNFEYFSEDPYLAGKMAAAYIRGIQANGVAACPKHFAVNSQELRRMCMDSVVDERTLREIYLTGFEIAVTEGKAKAIMSSYNMVNGTYGAHIFHANSRKAWEYVNRFAEFNRYTNSPVANYHGRLYSLPFNMYTFHQMWGVVTPKEAEEKIRRQRETAGITEPKNLEEQAISLVGTDIYETLVKGYTEKQWGRPCSELPAFIIKRLPVRFTFDNNYFNARYQGIPIGGYTQMVEKMLEGIEVRLNTDYLENREAWNALADRVVYTGSIDGYFDYCYGSLSYRSVRFETEVLDMPNYQGNAVVNYTDRETPYTRIIEHKFFEFDTQPKTVISREYSSEWKPGVEPYYPINDEANTALYEKYRAQADREKNTLFGGRLGEYRYYDMDAVVLRALETAERERERWN